MPPNSANAPTIVAELMAGENLRGEGAAPTKKRKFAAIRNLIAGGALTSKLTI